MQYAPTIIDGQPYDDDRRLPVLNPATEAAIAEVPRASRADLDAAVDAAP
jgi:acyl-CoA reductase-like NAD-dependent aldehyde dehydrogenase